MEHIKNKRGNTPSNAGGRDTTNTTANAQGISTGGSQEDRYKGVWKEIHICIQGLIQGLGGADGKIQWASNKALIPKRGKSLEKKNKTLKSQGERRDK